MSLWAQEFKSLWSRTGCCGTVCRTTADLPEAADSLHCSPIDGEGGNVLRVASCSPQSAALFCWHWDGGFVLPPRYQGSDLLSVGRLIVAGDWMLNSHMFSSSPGGRDKLGLLYLLRQGVPLKACTEDVQFIWERCRHYLSAAGFLL